MDLQILLGKVCHAMGRYREAENIFSKVCPLQEYQPFVYQDYGDVLTKLGREKEALPWFRRDIEEFEKTGEISQEVMLDGSFKRSLLLDIQYGEGFFNHDLQEYRKFLMQVDTSSEYLQSHLSDTVVGMSEELVRRWLRKREEI